MTEVIPGIYNLKLPLPEPATVLGHLNTYLIQGDDGYLLVDTGWNNAETFDSLKKQLDEIGIKVEDINRIVVTHIHPDHYGLAGRLKQLSGAEITIHQREKNLIESRYINMDELLQQIARWLHKHGVSQDELPDLQIASVGMAKFVSPTLPDVILHGGETISTGTFTLQVLWTPGHSPGHICLYEPTKKILLSGDHILPTITPNIGLHPQSGANPLGDYIKSLNTIKQLDVNLVLPGHETPFNNLGERIEGLIRHHKQRNSKILAKIKSEPKTAYQIARGMIWIPDKGGVRWQKLSPLDRRLALLETVAHIESMRIEGRINRFSKDSIIYYQQN